MKGIYPGIGESVLRPTVFHNLIIDRFVSGLTFKSLHVDRLLEGVVRSAESKYLGSESLTRRER
jgi:hypothetical protein